MFIESEWIESYNPATQTLIPSYWKYSTLRSITSLGEKFNI